MADYTKDSYYQLSLNILKALGGDVSISYPDADAIWEEIYKIYDHAGGRFDIVPLQETITKNGTYDYYPESGADAYMPVNITVSIPQDYTDEDVAAIRREATIEGYNTGYVEGELSGKEEGYTEGYTSGFTAGETEGYSDGYAEGLDDGVEEQKALLEEIVIRDNGVYEKEDGYNKITVEVEGAVTNLGVLQLVESTNGTYEYSVENYGDGVDGWHTVEVMIDVAQSGWTDEDLNEQYNSGWDQGYEQAMIDRDEAMETIEITENGTYTSSAGFSEVVVAVEGGGGGDTGKPKIYNGFKLLKNNNEGVLASKLSEYDFSQADWSGVYDLGYFFEGFQAKTGAMWGDASFSNFKQNYNGKFVSGQYMFQTAVGFNGYDPLHTVPDFGKKLTKDLVDMSYMFYECKRLYNAEYIANWDTSNVVNTSYMFYYCQTMKMIAAFDTSKVIKADNMFRNCSALTTLPEFDFGSLMVAPYMFAGCSSLTQAPEISSTQLANIQGMFSSCSKLVSVPAIDCTNVSNLNDVFYGCSALTDFGGFINYGATRQLLTTNNGILNWSSNLTYESLLNIINGLHDRTADGFPVFTFRIGSTNLAKLTEDDIAIATNKGWTIA